MGKSLDIFFSPLYYTIFPLYSGALEKPFSKSSIQTIDSIPELYIQLNPRRHIPTICFDYSLSCCFSPPPPLWKTFYTFFFFLLKSIIKEFRFSFFNLNFMLNYSFNYKPKQFLTDGQAFEMHVSVSINDYFQSYDGRQLCSTDFIFLSNLHFETVCN